MARVNGCRRWWVWLTVALGASACPNKTASVPRYPRFAYIVNPTEHALSVYQVLVGSRHLRPLGYQWFPRFNGGLRAFGDGDRLLVEDERNTSLYIIDDSTGFLSPGPATTVSPCPAPALLSDDDQYLFCLDPGDGNLRVLLFDGGSLSFKDRGSAPAPGSKVLALDPRQRFVLAGNFNASQITPIKLALPHPVSAQSAGPPWSFGQPLFAVIERSGRWVYVAAMVATNQWSLQVIALRDDGTAAGSPLQILPLTGRPHVLKLNRAGDEIFVGGPVLRSFVIDPATGMLAPSGRPLPAVDAGDVAFDPAGRFAYVPAVNFGPLTMIDLADPNQPGRSANMVDQFHPSWSMDQMEISTGTAPTRSSSKVLLVTDLTRNSLISFAIDQNDGSLTSVGEAPTGGSEASWLAVSPDGRFAYVVSSGSNKVTPFTVDRTTGAIAAVPPGTSLPGVARRIVVDRSGRSLLALIDSPAEVAVLPIDAATGALSATVDQRALSFSAPTSLTVSNQGDIVLATDAGHSGEVDMITLNPYGLANQTTNFGFQTRAFPVGATGSIVLGALFDPFDHAVAAWGDRSVVALRSAGAVTASGRLDPASETMVTAQPITTVTAAADGASLFAISADPLNVLNNASKVAHFSLDPSSGAFLDKRYEIQFEASVLNPVAARADASGRWFYVLDRDRKKIVLFDRDTSNGALETQATLGNPGTPTITRLIARTSFPVGVKPFDMQIVDVFD